MTTPTHRLVAKRKDGKSFQYTNYRGESATGQTCKLASGWAKDFGGDTVVNLTFEAKTLASLGDLSQFYVTLYENRDDGDSPRGRKSHARGDVDDMFGDVA